MKNGDMFEVYDNLGEITMVDPESGIRLIFDAGDSCSMRCVDMGTASGKEYVEISRKMTDYAYSEGLLEESTLANIRKSEFRKELGCRLREARKRLGLTLRDVEARTGVNKSVNGRTESGRANPTIDTIALLCDCYGLELELVERKENG